MFGENDTAEQTGRSSFHPHDCPFHTTHVDFGNRHSHLPSSRKFHAVAAGCIDPQRHPLSKWTSMMERYSWAATPIIWGISLIHSGSKLHPFRREMTN